MSVNTSKSARRGALRRPAIEPREALDKFFQTPWLFYFEHELTELAGILEANGMLEWAQVPKLYFILRETGYQHLISSFVAEGISDASIPVDKPRLLSTSISLTPDFLNNFDLFQAKLIQQPLSVYESHLATYLDSQRDFQRNPLDDVDFMQIARLLDFCGKPMAAKTPKLYYVLHLIRNTDILSKFHEQGYNDMWFPFPGYILRAPLISGRSVKEAFLRSQEYVCSSRWSEDVHLNFSSDEHDDLLTKKELGSGGTGEVSHIYCRSFRKNYARKLILRGQGLHYFAHEVKMLKSVNHRHCVSLVCSYTDPDYLAILTQPVADMNLGDLLDAATIPLDRKNLLQTIFGCLSIALAYLHAKGIVHKDIKPQNILVHGNNVLFTDFGLSADIGSETTSMVGYTPRYNSPEFGDGQSRDKTSDVWALGCVFLEILAALQGLSITNLKSYFRRTGSRRETFNANPEAIKSWLADEFSEEALSGFNSMALIARELTADMLRGDKSSRPTSLTLIRRLGKGLSPVATMYGACCREELKRAAQDISPGVVGATPFSQSQEQGFGEPLEAFDSMAEQTTKIERMEQSRGTQRPHQTNQSPEKALKRPEKLPLLAPTMDRATFDACTVTELATLLDQGLDPNWTDQDRLTALMIAIILDDEQKMRLLLEKGANVDITNKYGETALHVAAIYGNEDMARLLLENSADVDARAFGGRTALHDAVFGRWGTYPGREVDMIRLVLEYGANVNAIDDDGRTALYYAAMFKPNVPAARLLLESGADPSVRDNYGSTVYDIARQHGTKEMIALLSSVQGKENE